jgi:AbrB family looped-hinge helix DNA binding protein
MDSTLTVKGQTTIPKPIRDHLGLKPGDKVKFLVRSDGSVVILPKLPITALKGFLKSEVHGISLEDMDESIAEGAAGLPLRSQSK